MAKDATVIRLRRKPRLVPPPDGVMASFARIFRKELIQAGLVRPEPEPTRGAANDCAVPVGDWTR